MGSNSYEKIVWEKKNPKLYKYKRIVYHFKTLHCIISRHQTMSKSESALPTRANHSPACMESDEEVRCNCNREKWPHTVLER